MPDKWDSLLQSEGAAGWDAALGNTPSSPRAASGVLESAQAGWEGSATGLIARRKLPDVVLDPQHARWYEKLAAMATQTVAELPEMVAGGMAGTAAGSPAGPVGSLLAAGAGTFGVPTLIREALMQAYQSGEADSSGDFLSRTGIVVKQTAKDALVGAMTFGAGGAAAKAVGKIASPAVTEAANLTAQTGTMVVAPAALEGRLPEPDDFLNAAIMVAGGKAAGAVAGKIRDIYARTGVEPLQVVADAAKDPTIKAELASADPEIPKAYQPIAAEHAALDAVPGEKAQRVADNPFAPIPDQSEGVKPFEVNYRYINTTDDAKAVMSRLSDVYEAEIQTQRRGTVKWDKTMADANALLKSASGGKDTAGFMTRKPGTPAGDAELLARKQLMVGSVEATAKAAREYNEKVRTGTASPMDTAEWLASIERSAIIQAEFLGAKAEPGRALNAMKLIKGSTDQARALLEMRDMYGKDPAKLAEMMSTIDTPEGALKFVREATKATTWEKIVEAWKAGLVSGPVTHAANITGTGTFMAIRAPVDVLAATIHTLRNPLHPDVVRLAEPLAKLYGTLQGTADGLRIAAGILKSGEYGPSRAEQHRPAIEGAKGEIIRFPFRALASEDAVARTMNERGELYSQAFLLAGKENLNPLTREFRERIASLVENPTDEMKAEIAKAGDRFTFNTPLGEKGRAIQAIVNKWHLEWLAPFVRTPGNILKELARMTPVASQLVAEWRADMKAGGAKGDKAFAEAMIGGGLMGYATMQALGGRISGAGDPDPSKRRVDMAAGWQPYSVRIGDTWYSYARLQPVGTLIGMAADMAEIWEHTTPEERDRIPKMIAIAFSNAVTHQVWLQQVANVMNAVSDPDRYGAQVAHTFVGSVIPGALAQTAQMLDPLVREVHSSLEAIQSRVPGWREALLARRDPFGEPVPNKERVGGILPSTASPISHDPVRTEASRLGVGVAKTPDSTSLPAAKDRKLGKVELTPEQQDVFADVSGHAAYSILEPIVNNPTWKALPDMVQKRIYERAFENARKMGAVQALPQEQRDQEIQRITDEIRRRLER